MERYANIIIDISQEKLDKTFQYSIPEELQGKLKVGMRVQVPFGNGGRMISGFVVSLSGDPEIDPARIKPVAAIDEQAIVIESQLIALAYWMHKNYGATINQALKTVLPVKEKKTAKIRRKLVLTADEITARTYLIDFDKRRCTAKARLLRNLIAQKWVYYDVAIKEYNSNPALIKEFKEKNLIREEHERIFRNPVQKQELPAYDLELNDSQKAVVAAIQQNAASDRKPCLIHGVTGSGKTEVYMELIAGAIQEGKQAIVLIPEISLTFQTVNRFASRFGNRVTVLHSKMSPGERYDQYERARDGEVDVIIGPRSALFTPFSNLGYIIIDEEQEGSYKSETLPKYHARETAIERARMAGATVVMGSATPSIESYYRAKQGEYLLLHMPHRVKERPMPMCYPVDMREEFARRNFSVFSEQLRKLIWGRLRLGQQVMLFINRRGLASFVVCRDCGYVVKCPNCDVPLKTHLNGIRTCHYCGYVEKDTRICPQCGSGHLSFMKGGTERLEQLTQEAFPDARILRLDADTAKTKEQYENILSAFGKGEANILIGTQMIVKGHDFKGVTLMGILAADLSLYTSDYHAAERTFQLLTQAAGRTGRGASGGEVVIQTYNPDHYSIRCAGAQDYESFYEEEIFYRQMMHYPPVWHMLLILVYAPRKDEAGETAEQIAAQIAGMKVEGLQTIGPTDAILSRLHGLSRKVIYLKHADYQTLVDIKDKVEHTMEQNAKKCRATVQFDFDPMNEY
ncbi:MAG: primosomal protein N' [Lachnospiraceae bacterium]|nr:primosomal protein N' [Lachnospiraceae bacterium]